MPNNAEDDDDIKQRNEFNERLLKKQKTKQHKEIKEDFNFEDLRLKSRQNYLQKRQEIKLEKLNQKINDEEEMFKNVKLSKKELRELEYQKEILKLGNSFIITTFNNRSRYGRWKLY